MTSQKKTRLSRNLGQISVAMPRPDRFPVLSLHRDHVPNAHQAIKKRVRFCQSFLPKKTSTKESDAIFHIKTSLNNLSLKLKPPHSSNRSFFNMPHFSRKKMACPRFQLANKPSHSTCTYISTTWDHPLLANLAATLTRLHTQHHSVWSTFGLGIGWDGMG